MSASLVGSEMCIRDSLWVCAQCAHAISAASDTSRSGWHCSSDGSLLTSACLLYTSDAADDM
eukprot:14706032-Alexandrium_andersonii.AAC.1